MDHPWPVLVLPSFSTGQGGHNLPRINRKRHGSHLLTGWVEKNLRAMFYNHHTDKPTLLLPHLENRSRSMTSHLQTAAKHPGLSLKNEFTLLQHRHPRGVSATNNASQMKRPCHHRNPHPILIAIPPTHPYTSEKPAPTKWALHAGVPHCSSIKTHHSQTLRFLKDTLSCHLHNRTWQNRWSTPVVSLPGAVYANSLAQTPWTTLFPSKVPSAGKFKDIESE